MQPKIRELIRHMESEGFINRGTECSRHNLRHPNGINITISGNLSQDAKQYQVNDVDRAIVMACSKK